MSSAIFTLEGLKKSKEIIIDGVKSSDKTYKEYKFKPLAPDYETVEVIVTATTYGDNYSVVEKLESKKTMSLEEAFDEIESLRKKKHSGVYRYVRKETYGGEGYARDYEFKGYKTSSPKKRKSHSSAIRVNVEKMF